MNFSIDQWKAWAPGLDSAEAWDAWHATPHAIVDDGQQQPAVDFLPAMQRRRLSRLARMVCHIAWPLAQPYPNLPLVFASRHGETPRTLELIQELARGEALSPTQFSLSVHNAIIGLWSILRDDDSEMTAMAAEGDGLEQAMLEATSLLAEGAPAVLLVIAEEMPPALYRPYIDDVPFSYALALLLKPGDQWSLRLEPSDNAPAGSQWPHAISLLRALHDGQPRLEHQCKQRTWVWSCSKD